MHIVIYNGNDPSLLAPSTLESLNVDDDFLPRLKGAYSTCHYFSDENIYRKKRRLIEQSSDGLFRYHNHIVIPHPTLASIKALLIEYDDNDGHSNYRRLMASLLRRFWWDKTTFGCKSHCEHYIVCH